MGTSFDEQLTALHKQENRTLRTNIWQEGSPEFNRKLCIAEDLLEVKWLSTFEDTNYTEAKKKAPIITKLRDAMEKMAVTVDNHQTCEEYEQFSNLMKSLLEVKQEFRFTSMWEAFCILLECLQPTEIESLGIHTNKAKYHKLLQLSALYGFKMNSVKFGQNDKVDVTNAHLDFLKVVAIIRMFHSTLLYNMKPSLTSSSNINSLVTYGLLTETKFVRVIGIKVDVGIGSTYNYYLFNVGVFPLEPKTAEEKQALDTLISFLLESSRHTIDEEKELILKITKKSLGRDGLITSNFQASDFMVNDNLVISYTTPTSCLSTTVTLTKYRTELSTAHGQGSSQKEIFNGVIDHSTQPVFVKIFPQDEKILPLRKPNNVFLPISEIKKNGKLCSNHIEISLEGNELKVEEKRSREDKMLIMTQLLLELDLLHSKGVIHNDIKPSNIILLKKEHFKSTELFEKEETLKPFYCKLIDFELAKMFVKEDGNICELLDEHVKSTSGTSHYNAPEKEQGGDNYIHPKTDIFSLGLVFIELLIETDVNKKLLDKQWNMIENTCENLCPSKGHTIFQMLFGMVNRERKARFTASDCLKLLQVSETVDTQDYSSIFFPSKIESPQVEMGPKLKSLCCKCTTGNCSNCKCKDNGCTNCKSTNCKKRKRDLVDSKKKCKK